MPFSDDFHCFSGNHLNRAQVERRDSDWLAAQLSAPGARFVPFLGEVPLVAMSGEIEEGSGAADIGWLAMDDARTAHADRTAFHLLGTTAQGDARFACNILPKGAEFEEEVLKFEADGKFVDLRSIAMQGLMPAASASILAQAKSLIGWHKSHRFCSSCGAASVSAEGGLRRHCPSCKTSHFPRTDPVVIMLVVHGDECLLGRGSHYNEGQYSTLAGFVDQGESIEEAVRREIMEETSIEVGEVSYHSSQPWPFPSSLMIGCHGIALNHDIKIDTHEVEEAQWFSRADVTMMMERTHPKGLFVPARFAIAHHLIKHFVNAG